MELIFNVLLPLSIYFYCGCLLAFFAAAIKARQFVRAAVLGVFCYIHASFTGGSWGGSDAGSRLTMLVVVLASVCFGAVLVCCKQFPKREIFRKVIVIFAIVVGFLLGGATAFSLSPAYRTRDTVEQTATSPDGRYQAMRIDDESMYANLEFITIKPTHFSVFNILDYPGTPLTIPLPKAFFNVRWASQRTLVVECSDDLILYDPVESWHDVKIIYHVGAILRKKDGAYQ